MRERKEKKEEEEEEKELVKERREGSLEAYLMYRAINWILIKTLYCPSHLCQHIQGPVRSELLQPVVFIFR